MPLYHDSVSHTRVLDVDKVTRTKRLFHWDAAAQTYTIEEVQDQTDIIEQNLLDRNNINTSSWKGDMHKVASLPLSKWLELRKSGILQDSNKLRKWLNDRDNWFYRTREGRV